MDVTRSIIVILATLSLLALASSCNLQDDRPGSNGSNVEDDARTSDTSGTDASDILVADDADDSSSVDSETPDSDESDGESGDASDVGDSGPNCTAPEEACGDDCINTETNTDHCGSCDSPCDPPENAEVTGCVDGDCRFGCEEGYFDLNDDIFSDGCESACGPNATETCNGVDDDCDGDTDEGVQNTYYYDGDGDDYGDPNGLQQACSTPSGWTDNDEDCDDSDDAINPGASEICHDSGTDYDCDGEPACGDPDCDEAYCQTTTGSAGYCVNQTCVESGSCTLDTDCKSGLQCNSGCCCPSSDPCLCAQ